MNTPVNGDDENVDTMEPTGRHRKDKTQPSTRGQGIPGGFEERDYLKVQLYGQPRSGERKQSSGWKLYKVQNQVKKQNNNNNHFEGRSAGVTE